MGYTHYWKVERAPDDLEWKRFTTGIKSIVKLSPAPLAGPLGTGKPEVNGNSVAFNGVEPDDFETFRVERNVCDFEFCKTGHTPYDVAVVAALMLGKSIGFLSWSSDGEGDDHAEGLALFNKAV